jgi:HD-GYP domain-containing protein (c-di-GMP phosphodiesterase class II)
VSQPASIPPSAPLGADAYGAQESLDAIYALNIGDFVTETFLSDALVDKINTRISSEPQKVQQQLEELIGLYSVDKTLDILGFEPGKGFVIYDSVARTLVDFCQVDACHLFQVAQKDGGDSFLSLTGTSLNLDKASRWDIGVPLSQSDFLVEASQQRAPFVVSDVATQANWHPLSALGQEQAATLLAIPLREGGRSLGVLLFEAYQPVPFPPEMHQLGQVVGDLFVTSVRLQHLLAEAQSLIHRDTVAFNLLLNQRAQITESIADLGIQQQAFAEALANAIDARFSFTQGHSLRVAQVAKAITEALNLSEKTVDLVYYAGLTGSLVKARLPKAILEKKAALTPQEWDTVRENLHFGVTLLAKIHFLSEVVPYVTYRTERWNGSGSPECLAGRSIPIGSRILAVADAYCALAESRPYRDNQAQPALSHPEILTLLSQEAGTKWDPTVIAALCTLSPDLLSP